MSHRQIVLDTETTGLETQHGHRVIEIGCVELVDRRLTGRHFHEYINPDREIDPGAMQIHGITNEFVADKPRFGDIAQRFLEFIDGAQLVIHNAAFDIAFLNYELNLLDPALPQIQARCSVLDTLEMARQLHPGQRNNLDALCKRYEVDNTQRELHGALLDAEILADVYLAMTGGQTTLWADGGGDQKGGQGRRAEATRILRRNAGVVVMPTEQELEAHRRRLAAIDKAAGGQCVWLALTARGEEEVN